MKKFVMAVVMVLTLVLVCFVATSCDEYYGIEGQDSAFFAGVYENVSGPTGQDDGDLPDNLPTSIEILASSIGFERFSAELDSLVFNDMINIDFDIINDHNADFSIELTIPVFGIAALDAAIDAMISSRIDSFRATNDSGFFFARVHVYRHDAHFSSMAVYFRSYGENSGFYAAKDTMNFDMHNGRFIEMQNMFASDADFTDALAQLAESALNGRRITGTEHFTFNVYSLYLHIGEQTIDIPISDLHGIWLGNAPLRNGPIVALTFDDGPVHPYTAELLDMLKEHGVRATFFLLGIQIERHPDLVLRMYEEGHQIGNHSMGHPNFMYLNRTQIRDEIYRTNRLIEDITGYVPTTLRPPFGLRDETVLDVAAELDLSVILWSVDPQDWLYRDAGIVSAHVIEHSIDGSVVLLHDIRRPSIDATLRVIEQLLADGFTFVTIDELFAYNAITLEAGEVFHSPYRTARR